MTFRRVLVGLMVLMLLAVSPSSTPAFDGAEVDDECLRIWAEQMSEIDAEYDLCVAQNGMLGMQYCLVIWTGEALLAGIEKANCDGMESECCED